MVMQGVTLTIEPGVELRFRDSMLLQIDGTIRAIGTEEHPIVFTRMPGSNFGWGGIFFSETAIDYDSLNGMGSIISYAQLLHGRHWNIELASGYRQTNPLVCSSSSPLIDHCEIACYKGYIGIDNSNAVIRNCNIHDGTNGFVINPFASPSSTKPVIENCLLHDLAMVYDWRFPRTYALDVGGPVLFRNNCVRNIRCDLAVRDGIGAMDIQILNNEFSGCANAAIGSFGVGNTSKYIGNTFTGNRINIVFLACAANPQIYGNNFNGYIDYNVYAAQTYLNFAPNTCPSPGTMFDMDMENNYWGGLSLEEIDQSIHDFNDNFLEAIRIDYESVADNPFPFTEPEAGSFVDKADCDAVTASMNENQSNARAMEVWPNPAPASVLNVRVSAAGSYTVRIMNMTGQTVYSAERTVMADETVQLPLTGLSAGTYVLTCTSAGNSFNQRIIVFGN